MRRHLPIPLAGALIAAIGVTVSPQSRSDRPTRDRLAEVAAQSSVPKGRISGTVVAADTGRPVKRARVFVSAPQLTDGRGTLTDDNGSFEFPELPEGRYTLSVSKTGFVNLSYGQRRPLQAGTPIQLADGQQLAGIEFRLPRGGVIAGRVVDESGDAAPGISVRALQYRYAQGNRQLVPAGTAQTDDQGAYRIWGLNPGEYYVAAVVRNFGGGGRGPGPFAGQGGPAGVPPGGPALGLGGRGAPASRPGAGPTDAEQLGYAPTFYPGVPTADGARSVRVDVSGEMLDISFGLLLVQTSRVAGRVSLPGGSSATVGTVTLTPEAGPPGRGSLGNLGSRIQWDGTFGISGVPPGRYTLRARSDDTDPPQYAMQSLALSGGDLTNLGVLLAPGGSITGIATIQQTRSAAALDVTQLRISAPAVDYTSVGPNPTARVDKEGRFVIDGVPAGPHLLRAQSTPRGWSLKSVLVGSRDVIDTPIEIASGQKLVDVTLVFTDQLSELNGTLSDERGRPITEYTVLAFPTDASLWRPQARQIMTARPDQNGRYQMRGLPAGEYFVAAIDPAEPGEWFEPTFLELQRSNAARVLIGDGDVRTQDFKLTLR